MKFPLHPQSATAGQAVRIIDETPLWVEVVRFNPDNPDTGNELPESMGVNGGPKSVHVTNPSCGMPVESVTVCIPAETGLSAERATRTPPAGAVPDSVAVPLTAVPPLTAAGFKVMDESTAGFMVRVAICVAW